MCPVPYRSSPTACPAIQHAFTEWIKPTLPGHPVILTPSVTKNIITVKAESCFQKSIGFSI